MRKLDIVEFILRSNRIHNNFYDYSISKYDTKEKIEIICPKHGIFHQRASSHMSGSGCKKCYDEKRHFQSKTLDINFFLENSIKKHGDKYDYSESEYINSYTKLKLYVESMVHFIKFHQVILPSMIHVLNVESYPKIK